jgi:AcrR family transcriptional regulator
MAEKKYHHGDLKNALIEAGAEILSEEGVDGLSLRKVAGRAGVSHAAPYAHFPDKQTLIAAISTEGYRMLYERIEAASRRHQGDPARQLVEASWAYIRFAMDHPAHFKVTLSGVMEKEKEYPAFVEMTQQTFALVVGIIAACQQNGILKAGPADVTAVSVWSLVHGIASLYIEDQISHTVLEHTALRDLLIYALNQFTLVELRREHFSLQE